MAKKKTDKMQQLIKSDNSIIRELRDSQWLYNPRVYATIAGDFTLMHQRVLTGVLEKLQDRIVHSAAEHQKNQQLWLPLFPQEEMDSSVDFELDPKDLGVTPGHYPELVKALEDLVGMKIGYPKKKGNKTVYVFASLFSRLEMPMGENGWRKGKVRVKMDKENVNDFLSMDRGYTENVARLPQFSKKQRTPRIYTYLSTFRYKGRDEVSYPDLCEYLGIDDEHYVAMHRDENPAVKPTDNPFHKYSKVKKLILEPSRLEMDKFSAERKIDFSFTYEPKYNDGRLKGNPTHIEFVIVLGPLGIERDFERNRHNRLQSVITSLTNKFPDLNAYDLVELTKEVQNDWIDDFCQYAYDGVCRQVEKTQPDHVADYVLTLLGTWIKDKSLEAQRKQVENERQYQLFAEQECERRVKALATELEQLLGISAADFEFESYDAKQRTVMIRIYGRDIYEQIEETEDKQPGRYQQQYFALLKRYLPNISPRYRILPPK